MNGLASHKITSKYISSEVYLHLVQQIIICHCWKDYRNDQTFWIRKQRSLVQHQSCCSGKDYTSCSQSFSSLHILCSSLPCFFPSGPATPCFFWPVPPGVVRQPHCTHLPKIWLSPLLSGSTLTQTLFCPGIQVCYYHAAWSYVQVLANVVWGSYW